MAIRHAEKWMGILMIGGFIISGCTIHPPGEKAERAVALGAGSAFVQPFQQRAIPTLPDHPTPDDLVRCALLANADLEQRYWEWRAALEQIPQDGTQTTTLAFAAGTTITKGSTGAASSSLGLLNDPMTDIHWPGTLAAAAQRSLENARVAGLRFRKAQYQLRSQVLAAYDDYALTAELIRLEQANRRLLQTTAALVEARHRAGTSGQQDLLKAHNEVDLAGNEIAAMEAQLPAQRASINALIGRSPDDPLPPPTTLPPAAPMRRSDAEILDLIARNNPELAALAAEIRAKRGGIQIARLQYIPDFNLSLTTDLMGIAQNLAGSVTVPLLRYQAIDASIAQAYANLRAAEAMERRTHNDLDAQVILDLSVIRDADRQLELFEQAILPRAGQIVSLARTSYESGQTTLLELLDSQRAQISLQRLVVTLRVSRAKHLVDLEAVAARGLTDSETNSKFKWENPKRN